MNLAVILLTLFVSQITAYERPKRQLKNLGTPQKLLLSNLGFTRSFLPSSTSNKSFGFSIQNGFSSPGGLISGSGTERIKQSKETVQENNRGYVQPVFTEQSYVQQPQAINSGIFQSQVLADLRTLSPAFEQENEDILEQDWNAFTTTFNKVYASQEEARYRREIFFENKAKVLRLNAEYAVGKRNFVHKINEFADLLLHEFNNILNGFNMSKTAAVVPPKAATTFIPSTNVVFPVSVDWRMVGAVGPVKHQGQCAGCYAFAAAGALEGHHFRRTGNLVDVSEQNLIDCTKDYGNNGCSGGLMDPAFHYVHENNGVDSEQSYPYEAKTAECRFKRENVVVTCTGFVDIDRYDEKGLEVAIATLGPVAAAIDAGRETFQFYSEGIYDDPTCGNKPEQMNHAVLVVGYGQEVNGQQYWLVKNSYGTSWGIGGYIKIAKGINKCGIAIKASYPLV